MGTAMIDGKPILVDLYCCAGGATKGYQRAGFYVIGVDIDPQPHYCGDVFVQRDALNFLSRLAINGYVHIPGYGILELADIAAFHASPPCQKHSAEAIPPVYAKYVGDTLMNHLIEDALGRIA